MDIERGRIIARASWWAYRLCEVLYLLCAFGAYLTLPMPGPWVWAFIGGFILTLIVNLSLMWIDDHFKEV